MPRFDQRRLPLLVVLVAVLGVLGVVVADGWAARGGPAGVEVMTVPGGDTSATAVDSVDSAAGVQATRSAGQARGGVSHPVERAGFVQLAADHVRPVAQGAPALTVLAALFAAAAAARSVVATVATVVARPLPLAHVRRRGPPALAVV